MTPKPGPRPPIEPARASVPVDGRAVRAKRKAKGLTMVELAAGSGISRSYVSMIERGERGTVSPAVVTALATRLGVAERSLRLRSPR